MDYVIKVSKTVEDAVDEALEELGVSKEEVNVEVLEEPVKGFLGLIGGRDATVKVTVVDNSKEEAEEFIDIMLKSMGVDGDIKVESEKGYLKVLVYNVDAKKKGILIGKRGNTLDAVQYLLSLKINNNNNNYKKVLIDVDGYREKRKNTLERLAVNMGKKALRQKRAVKLEPMNAYERKIIHSALQVNNKVTTFSEGNEPNRRVVIQPK